MVFSRLAWGVLVCLAIAVLLCDAHDDREVAFFPQFHARPERNWVNDPNGPFYDPKHKRYHLWMQYNPYGNAWGDMSWYHLVSADLVSWRRLGVTLYNDDPVDAFGVFSGSVTVLDDGNLVMSYTCTNATQAQKQCAAVPVDRDGDPDLVEWRRVPGNPLVPNGPFESERVDMFRDPGVGFKVPSVPGGGDVGGFKYRQIVAAFYEPDVAAIALYDSKNLTANLEFAGILLEMKTLLRLMMECPDYFPLADAAYGADGGGDGASLVDAKMALFKYSDMGAHQDVWHLGFNDVVNATGAQTWTAACPAVAEPTVASSSSSSLERCDIDGTPGRPVGGPVDYGLFYASVTFWDAPNKRRVLWGWLDDEYDVGAYPPRRPWRGAMSLPRVVTYDAKLRQLRTPPIPELRALRRESIVARPPPSPPSASPSSTSSPSPSPAAVAVNGSTAGDGVRRGSSGKNTLRFPMAIETDFVAPSVMNFTATDSAATITSPMFLTRRRDINDASKDDVAAVQSRKKKSALAGLLGGASAGVTGLLDAQYEVVAVISVDRATFDAARRIEVGLDILFDDSASRHKQQQQPQPVVTRRRTFVGVVADRRLSHMRSRQIHGGEYRHVSTVTSAPNRTAREAACASVCTADIRCIAWSHDDSLKRCFLKARINSVSPRRTVPNRAAGVLAEPMFGVWRGRSGTEGHTFPQFGRVVDLRTNGDGTRYIFNLHVFVDRTIIEAFKDGGLERVATHVYNPHATSLVAAACRVASAGGKRARVSSAATVESFEAWRLGGIWPDGNSSSLSDGRLWGSIMKKRHGGVPERPRETNDPRRPPPQPEIADAHLGGFGEPEHGHPAHTAHPANEGWSRARGGSRDREGAGAAAIFGAVIATSVVWATIVFLYRRSWRRPSSSSAVRRGPMPPPTTRPAVPTV